MITKSKAVQLISYVLTLVFTILSFNSTNLYMWYFTVLLFFVSVLISYYQHKEEKQREQEDTYKEQVNKLLWRFTDFKALNVGSCNVFEIGLGGIRAYLKSIDNSFTTEEILQLHKLGQLTEHDLEVIVKLREHREQNNY